MAREKRAADLLFGTANFNNDTATNEFGGKFNAAGAEPLSDLHELKDTVFEAAHGINPDTMIFGRQVFRQLARNPEVRGFAGSAAAGIASGERVLNDEVVIGVLRDVLGIPNIYVGQARQDTAVPVRLLQSLTSGPETVSSWVFSKVVTRLFRRAATSRVCLWQLLTLRLMIWLPVSMTA